MLQNPVPLGTEVSVLGACVVGALVTSDEVTAVEVTADELAEVSASDVTKVVAGASTVVVSTGALLLGVGSGVGVGRSMNLWEYVSVPVYAAHQGTSNFGGARPPPQSAFSQTSPVSER